MLVSVISVAARGVSISGLERPNTVSLGFFSRRPTRSEVTTTSLTAVGLDDDVVESVAVAVAVSATVTVAVASSAQAAADANSAIHEALANRRTCLDMTTPARSPAYAGCNPLGQPGRSRPKPRPVNVFPEISQKM